MTWQWMMVIITLIIMASVVIITLQGQASSKEALERSLRDEQNQNDRLHRQIFDLNLRLVTSGKMSVEEYEESEDKLRNNEQS